MKRALATDREHGRAPLGNGTIKAGLRLEEAAARTRTELSWARRRARESDWGKKAIARTAGLGGIFAGPVSVLFFAPYFVLCCLYYGVIVLP